MAEAARAIDRVDLGFTRADAERLSARYADTTTLDVLRALLTDIAPGSTAVVSSFGTESAVLLDLVRRVDPGAPVILLDTLKLFPETLDYRDTLVRRLGLTGVRTVTPEPAVLTARDGKELRWSYDPDGCCEIRKVQPLAPALQGFSASLTGHQGLPSSAAPRVPHTGVRTFRSS